MPLVQLPICPLSVPMAQAPRIICHLSTVNRRNSFDLQFNIQVLSRPKRNITRDNRNAGRQHTFRIHSICNLQDIPKFKKCGFSKSFATGPEPQVSKSKALCDFGLGSLSRPGFAQFASRKLHLRQDTSVPMSARWHIEIFVHFIPHFRLRSCSHFY